MLKSNLLSNNNWVVGNNSLTMTEPTVSGYSVFMPITCHMWTGGPFFFKGITSNGTNWIVTYYNNGPATTTSIGIDCYWLMIKS